MAKTKSPIQFHTKRRNLKIFLWSVHNGQNISSYIDLVFVRKQKQEISDKVGQKKETIWHHVSHYTHTHIHAHIHVQKRKSHKTSNEFKIREKFYCGKGRTYLDVSGTWNLIMICYKVLLFQYLIQRRHFNKKRPLIS